ncbi:MAG: carboxypeptidase-like regulatory domain-containing protein [Saprospiraceae bacterium]|nr:carboxypeptidase-like regulatory domain-containing protein [Saprospiraceae bacterium]MBP7922825.1 carboxypeptidase-like regulatory domain-containing protein [Saprospiraceae bacterium]
MQFRISVCLFLLGLGLNPSIVGQSISGLVRDETNVPLPYATIQVTKTNKGAVTNQDGFFQIQIDPGTYNFRFQYVGYRIKDTTIVVGTKDISIKLNLRAESLTLPTVVIDGSNEDPAYTIMRRAIAKASYHANQINSYSARVYIKGSGRLLKIPFLFKNRIKKELAKEGIDSTVAFTQESVSRLHYKRPGQYTDTVLSIRATGDDNNTSPMGFVNSSFYDPKVSGAVSPLAPNAFQIYKFEYLGFFEEHGAIINKIKVTPKSKGDQVFEGTIYIIDQVWNIHSLNLLTSIWGIEFAIKQVFTPVQGEIWMPLDQIYDVGGNVFGFGFEYKYLAHLSDYKITINPDISVPLIVLDDKVDKEESVEANKKINNSSNPLQIKDLDMNQELSAKQLRKMMKQYKKQELDSLPESETISINSTETHQTIDSMANKRDSLYWDEIRPVALTEYESKGYTRMDSITKVEKIKEEENKRDSSSVEINIGSDGTELKVNKTSKKFKLNHLIVGSNYIYNKDKNYLTLFPLANKLNFNTVDGYHGALSMELGNKGKSKSSTLWKIRPEIGYTLARKVLTYELTTSIASRNNKKDPDYNPWKLVIAAGKVPVSYTPYLTRNNYFNTFYSLFFRKNYLKLYDSQYVRASFAQTLSKKFSFAATATFDSRMPLVNHSTAGIANRKKAYTSNIPTVSELNPGSITANMAFITEVSAIWKPFHRFAIRNGYKIKDLSKSPTISLLYKKGWEVSDGQFDQAQIGFKHHISVGAGDDFDYDLVGGSFLGTSPKYVQDFAHFPGNQYIFSPLDPVKFFRALDYFEYSTNAQYLSFLGNYQFRRFILSSSPWVRKKGIRENLIINALSTTDHPLYSELGYGINYIFRVLRVEGVTTWQDGTYQGFRFRFGLATGFDNLFKF